MLVCKSIKENSSLILNPSTKEVSCTSCIVDPDGPVLSIDTNTGIIYTDFLKTGASVLQMGAPSLNSLIQDCALTPTDSITLGEYYISNSKDPYVKENLVTGFSENPVISTYSSSSNKFYLWRYDNSYCVTKYTTAESKVSSSLMRYKATSLFFLYKRYALALNPSRTWESIGQDILKVVNASWDYTKSMADLAVLGSLFHDSTGTASTIINNFTKATIKPPEPRARIYVDNTTLKLSVETNSSYTSSYYINTSSFIYPNNITSVKWTTYKKPVTLPLNEKGLFSYQILLKNESTYNYGSADSLTLTSNIVSLPATPYGSGELYGDELECLASTTSNLDGIDLTCEETVDNETVTKTGTLICNPY